jgi:polyisoprenoid-binding protein YceI
VTIELELVGSGKHMMDPKIFLVGFTGELAIKRTDFDMKAMVGPAGDEIELLIAVEAARK